MSDEYVLQLDRLTKKFGGFSAVEDLSFSVGPGEIFGFLGPNGAGKTTTLRMILDIIPPTSGTLKVLGSSSAIPIRWKIGYLPEERGLYKKMKAADSIAYFARLRGVPARQAKAKAYELLDRFGLGEFAKVKCESLSKGMAQKVQVLTTIAHDPDLLILDEPFSGLDPINQHTLEELILELRKDGKTIIFSTHVMQHAERLCDRFLILADGKSRFEGTLEQARKIFPPRLIVRTSDPIGVLKTVPGVVSADPIGDPIGGEQDHEIVLTRDADPQAVLRAAFDAGLRLSRFENANASLHDIFKAVAGDAMAGGAMAGDSVEHAA